MSKPVAERTKWQEFHAFFCEENNPDPACLICYPPEQPASKQVRMFSCQCGKIMTFDEVASLYVPCRAAGDVSPHATLYQCASCRAERLAKPERKEA